MEAVSFPFRLVLQSEGGEMRPVSLDGRAVAFSSPEAAAAFIASRGAGGLRPVLVGRAVVPTLLARLRGWGLKGLLLDPTEDNPGVAVDLDALGPLK
jgi:hypothetical protein